MNRKVLRKLSNSLPPIGSMILIYNSARVLTIGADCIVWHVTGHTIQNALVMGTGPDSSKQPSFELGNVWWYRILEDITTIMPSTPFVAWDAARAKITGGRTVSTEHCVFQLDPIDGEGYITGNGDNPYTSIGMSWPGKSFYPLKCQEEAVEFAQPTFANKTTSIWEMADE